MIKFELNWSSFNIKYTNWRLLPLLQNQQNDKDYTSFDLSSVIKWPNMSSMSVTITQSYLQFYYENAAILPHKPHFQTNFEKFE